MKTINKLEQLKKEMDQAEVTNYEADRASYIAYKAWQDAIKAYETELNNNQPPQTNPFTNLN